MTLFIVDGITNETITQVLPLKGGYGGMLFVGDFNQDFIEDVYVSVSSGGSGNINYYYLYSFREKTPIQLFDYEKFNEETQWQVTFQDGFKIELTNGFNQTFRLDVSKKIYNYYLSTTIRMEALRERLKARYYRSGDWHRSLLH